MSATNKTGRAYHSSLKESFLFVTSKRGALARREHARHGARSLRPIIEERRRPGEPAHPPAEHLWHAAGENAERRWSGRIPRERRCSRVFEKAAARRTECFVQGTAAGLAVHEGMNDADDGEMRPGGAVADRRPATFG